MTLASSLSFRIISEQGYKILLVGVSILYKPIGKPGPYFLSFCSLLIRPYVWTEGKPVQKEQV